MAKKSINDIEKLFKETIGGHLEPPSASTWEAIEKQLDEKSTDKRRSFFFFKRWTLLLLMLIIGTAGYFIYSTYSPPPLSSRNKNDVFQKEPVMPLEGKISASEKTKTAEGTTTGKNRNNIVSTKDKPVTETEKEQITENQISDIAITNKGERKSYTASLHTGKVPQENKQEDHSEKGMAKQQKATAITTNTKSRNGNTANTRRNRQNKQAKKTELTALASNDPLHQKEEKRTTKHINSFQNDVVFENQEQVRDTLNNKKAEALQNLPKSLEKNVAINRQVADSNLKNILQPDTTHQKRTQKKKAATFKPFFTISAVYAPNDINNKLEQGVQQYKEDEKEEIKQQETIKKSYAYGVLVEYSFREHWAIQSGLKSTSTVTSIQTKHIFARPDITTLNSMLNYKYNSTSGYAYIPNIAGLLLALGDSVKTLPSVSTINYATAPLTLQYSPTIGRFSFVGTAGVAMNFLTRATLDTEIDFFGFRFGRIYEIQGLKKTYFSGNLGLGLGYGLSNKISFFFSPSKTFSFGPVNENTPVKKYERTTRYQALLRYRL